METLCDNNNNLIKPNGIAMYRRYEGVHGYVHHFEQNHQPNKANLAKIKRHFGNQRLLPCRKIARPLNLLLDFAVVLLSIPRLFSVHFIWQNIEIGSEQYDYI